MNPAERIAFALSEQLAGLDVAAMAAHPAFRHAVETALAVSGETEVVAQVVGLGPLTGALNPHAVVVSRLRKVPALVADRLRIADEHEEVRRWTAVDRAARRGETLRALVERGDLFADEATAMVGREFDDPDLAAIAIAAVTREKR